MALNRNSITLPTPPKEAVYVEQLGGEIIVRGLMLKDRLELFSDLRGAGKSYAHIGKLLAAAVGGEDGQPLLTVGEWETFGGQHLDKALEVFEIARRLAGLDTEVIEKN